MLTSTNSSKHNAPQPVAWKILLNQNVNGIMQQLLDLASNSWADIAFSVHVWFAHKARAPHEQAIKCICWLVSQRHCRTRTHSFSYQEPKELIVNCYVDTDFAGLWGAKDEQSPLCVKSQTGCVAANPE